MCVCSRMRAVATPLFSQSFLGLRCHGKTAMGSHRLLDPPSWASPFFLPPTRSLFPSFRPLSISLSLFLSLSLSLSIYLSIYLSLSLLAMSLSLTLSLSLSLSQSFSLFLSNCRSILLSPSRGLQSRGSFLHPSSPALFVLS